MDEVFERTDCVVSQFRGKQQPLCTAVVQPGWAAGPRYEIYPKQSQAPPAGFGDFHPGQLYQKSQLLLLCTCNTKAVFFRYLSG